MYHADKKEIEEQTVAEVLKMIRDKAARYERQGMFREADVLTRTAEQIQNLF